MDQASFNFMTAVTIRGDFSRPKCLSQLQPHPSIPALGCWGWDSAHQGEPEGSCLAGGLEGTDSLGVFLRSPAYLLGNIPSLRQWQFLFVVILNAFCSFSNTPVRSASLCSFRDMGTSLSTASSGVWALSLRPSPAISNVLIISYGSWL